MKLKLIFFQRTFWLLIAIAAAVIILGFLGVRSKAQWEKVVIETLNQQQLAIARSIAGRLENYFAGAAENLQLYTELHYNDIIQNPSEVFMGIDKFHVYRITLIFPSGTKTIIGADDIRSHKGLTEREKKYLLLRNKNQPYISDTYQAGPRAPRAWAVDIVTFYKTVAVAWTIDVIKICQEATANVRSGKSGYAWIINRQGYLLAHIDKGFLGENAFLARSQRFPALSFTRINMLQKEYLLTGKEGTSWYISGWHRGERKDPIKKLIAYTPAFYAGPDDTNIFWAVAVSAPVDEIKGLVRHAVMYQWLLMGIAFLMLGVAAGHALYTKWRWASVLAEEVNHKTEELERTHQALLQSERLAAMGTAAAHVAHEIKNPLMVIGGFAQQVLRTVEKDDKAKKKLLTITNEVKRLEGFLQDIGHFAKDITPQRERLDINESIEEVITFVEAELADRKIAVHLNVSLYPLYTLADPDQLKQVLLNIVKNAMEAMPKGGHLTISTRKNGEALIEINDTGNGIAQEALDKVFNPFFTTKKAGTGLGLAICHNIITAHNGTISIQSEGEDKGIMVIIRLPLLVDA